MDTKIKIKINKAKIRYCDGFMLYFFMVYIEY